MCLYLSFKQRNLCCRLERKECSTFSPFINQSLFRSVDGVWMLLTNNISLKMFLKLLFTSKQRMKIILVYQDLA